MVDKQFSEPEPAVWQQKKIGDILLRIQGGNANATSQMAVKATEDEDEDEEELTDKAAEALAIAANSYPFIQSSDLKSTRKIKITRRILKTDADKANLHLVSEECVLLAAARPATVGRCGVLSEEAIINNAIQALIPDITQVTVDFLFYYFRLPIIQKILRDTLINHGQTRLRFGDTQALQISLPPKELQERITRRLNALIAEIELSRSVIEGSIGKFSKVRELSINKIFNALEQGRDNRRIPLGDIITPLKADLISRDEKAEYDDIDYIALKALGNGTIRDSEKTKVASTKELPAKFYAHVSSPSTILYALTAPHLGRIALLRETKPLAYSTNIVALEVNTTICDPEFCMWALIAAPVTRFITGTVISRVNLSKLLEYNFHLPPLAEQRRIVTTLDDIRERLSALSSTQQEQRKKLDELEQNIIVRALRGDI